jgi:hypothetical protein
MYESGTFDTFTSKPTFYVIISIQKLPRKLFAETLEFPIDISLPYLRNKTSRRFSKHFSQLPPVWPMDFPFLVKNNYPLNLLDTRLLNQ